MKFKINPVYAPEGGATSAFDAGGAPPPPDAAAAAAAAAAGGAPPTPPTPPTPPPGGAPASWFGKLSAEDRSYAENKGWKEDTDPSTMLQSYQNLEKLFGADKAGRTLLAPKDANDKAALDAIYDRLGRPKTPEEYKIELPAEADAEFATTAKNWFHKAGLTVDQAKAVTDNYRALELDRVAKTKEAHATEVEGIKKEWGTEYDGKVETARAALNAAGLTPAQVKAMEYAIGPAATVKAMEFFGRNYKEAGPPGTDQRTNSGFNSMTPQAALSRMDALRGDPEFQARYNHNDPKVRGVAIEEMDKLAQLAVNAKV